MWIDWDNPTNVLNISTSSQPLQQCSQSASLPPPPPHRSSSSLSRYRRNDHFTRELLSENKRLWHELKEKNESLIALRDEIYFKEREIGKLERHKDELDRFKNDDQYLHLVREINGLRDELREKRSLCDFLNQMVENLCDEVLQNEHVDALEANVARLENDNQRLSKLHTDIEVKLKIVEYENDKLHTRSNQLDDENHQLRKKLEKCAKRLKERENSVLTFRKFTELANNLQSRIGRSTGENRILKRVIDRMKTVADNYERIERDNARLERDLKQVQIELDRERDQSNALRTAQRTREPALEHEVTELRQLAAERESKIDALQLENVKLRNDVQIYEKMLVENRAFVADLEKRVEDARVLLEENEKLKRAVRQLGQRLENENENKRRAIEEFETAGAERQRIIETLAEADHCRIKTTNELVTTKRERDALDAEIRDLRKQLRVYKNTLFNQESTLKIRATEIENLLRENGDLRSRLTNR